MQKRVNIVASVPVTDLKIPIRGAIRNIMMDVEDIRLCLFRKAKVEEVISDDVTVKLDFTNYDKDNGANLAETAPPVATFPDPEEELAKYESEKQPDPEPEEVKEEENEDETEETSDESESEEKPKKKSQKKK
nr:MAG TPA: hypothetical protein [Caudoviricetes sp.]